MSTQLTPIEQLFAAQVAERHRIPRAIVSHPAVVVPGDPFMTEKLRDRDYVPYCGPCVPMQRVRRVADGYQCPTCGNKMNYDLTHFNGNVDVQYEDQPPAAVSQHKDKPLTRCAAARDGDCTHKQCPQLRDNEPAATGRHCPLDTDSKDD
jgi:hypothetical protein